MKVTIDGKTVLDERKNDCYEAIKKIREIASKKKNPVICTKDGFRFEIAILNDFNRIYLRVTQEDVLMFSYYEFQRAWMMDANIDLLIALSMNCYYITNNEDKAKAKLEKLKQDYSYKFKIINISLKDKNKYVII